MRHAAAVLCYDRASLETLKAALKELAIDPMVCPSRQEALELILTGRCSTLIVDFDLPGAEEVIRVAALLPPGQKPNLLAIAGRAWPGTGQAFHSGANRILYRPVDAEQLKNALRTDSRVTKKNRRKSVRCEMKTLVYLDLGGWTLPAISIDISEHGLALQAIEPVPLKTDLAFRCVLPGTGFTLQGHAEVIWASDQGRAGLFFSDLAPAVRKHLKHWISRRRSLSHDKHALRDLLPPEDAHVSFATSE